MAIRPVSVLTDVAVPAWPELRGAIDSAPAHVEVLGVNATSASQTLHALQVTGRHSGHSPTTVAAS